MVRNKNEDIDVLPRVDYSEGLGPPMKIVALIAVANLRKNVGLYVFCRKHSGGACLDSGEHVLRRDPIFTIVHIDREGSPTSEVRLDHKGAEQRIGRHPRRLAECTAAEEHKCGQNQKSLEAHSCLQFCLKNEREPDSCIKGTH